MYFDVETTGASTGGQTMELCQISMSSRIGNLNIYVFPSCPITPIISKIRVVESEDFFFRIPTPSYKLFQFKKSTPTPTFLKPTPTPAFLKTRLRLLTPTPAFLKTRLRLLTPTTAILKKRLRLQLKTCDSTDSDSRLHNPSCHSCGCC